MKVLKGFMNIQSLFSNKYGEVSPVGEISTWSSTFTKERGEYNHPTLPDYRLVSTKNINTELEELEIDEALVNLTIEVVHSVKQYMMSHTKPYNVDYLVAEVLAENYGKISSFTTGMLIDSHLVTLPEWISFVSVSDPDQFVKIWLSDEAFKNQYDEFDISVIPYFDNLDDFFQTPNAVKERLAKFDYTLFVDQIQENKGDDPETYFKVLSFDYVNPNFPQDKTKTYWGVLIYGEEGNYIDSIKDAIIDFILNHSTKSRDEWEKILPDLFKRTEFVILPRWDKYAIPNLVFTEGIYSSWSHILETLDFAKNHTPFYQPNHVEQNTLLIPFPYKNITLVFVNGDKNIEGKQHIDLMFSDYLREPNISLDFRRMTEYTRNWCNGLHQQLMWAEKASETITVKRPYRKIVRGGKMYVSWLYDNVNYLMLVKKEIL